MKMFSKKTLYFITAVISVLLFSCSSERSTEIPKGVIDRSEMIQIVADIHTADAAVEHLKLEHVEEIVMYKKSYYESVLRNYSITDSIFQLSYNYYSVDVDSFSVFYDEVLNELSIRDANLQADIEKKIEESNEPEPQEKL
jgi:hypothetical protein